MKQSPWKFDPPPTFAPTRDLSYRTEGREIAKTSRLLGRYPMPWQQRVYDIGTQYRNETITDPATGVERTIRLYKYRTVIVCVPRQSGKTTSMAAVRIHRMITRAGMLGEPITLFSTAQTGKDAKKRMKDMIRSVIKSPLGPLFKPVYSAGETGLILKPNKTQLSMFAPVLGAIHGETPHFVDLDEIWKLDDDIGKDIFEGAIDPAQITLGRQSQTWLFSTMGTHESGFMNKLIESAMSGAAPGVALFLWQLPDGADPYNPKDWWTFHPALGNTQAEADLIERMPGQTRAGDTDEDDGPARSHSEWMRAYMNRLTASEEPLYPPEVWDSLADPEMTAKRSEVSIAYEVAADNSSAAVVAGWYDEANRPCVRIVHSAPGTTWLVPLVKRIKRDWAPAAIGADDGGTTRRINDELARDGIEVTLTGFRDFATACDSLLVAVDDAQLKHDGSVTFSAELGIAVVHSTGEARKLSRKYSAGPIPALIAGAVALWNHSHQPTYSKAIFR